MPRKRDNTTSASYWRESDQAIIQSSGEWPQDTISLLSHNLNSPLSPSPQTHQSFETPPLPRLRSQRYGARKRGEKQKGVERGKTTSISVSSLGSGGVIEEMDIVAEHSMSSPASTFTQNEPRFLIITLSLCHSEISFLTELWSYPSNPFLQQNPTCPPFLAPPSLNPPHPQHPPRHTFRILQQTQRHPLTRSPILKHRYKDWEVRSRQLQTHKSRQ